MSTLQYISPPKLQDFHYTPKALDGPSFESWLEEEIFSPPQKEQNRFGVQPVDTAVFPWR
jgi:hypothetical protein